MASLTSRPDGAVRTYAYSGDGRLFASASAQGVQILDASTATVVAELPCRNAIDLSFSPKGTLLSTWERHGPSRRPERRR